MTTAASVTLAHVSVALANALEADDLDAAERLFDERSRLLEALLASPDAKPAAPAAPPSSGARGPVMTLTVAAVAVQAADRRSEAALARTIARLRGEMAGLGRAASAVRAYVPSATPDPALVDRRD
jgi:hypothetical protein